ncbi:MAG: histidine kinase [Ruminococcus sp.]|nr:histidine kinase [Ruminococcus sp.]
MTISARKVSLIEKYTFTDYITNNYITLLLLAALTMLLIVNRRMKISGLRYYGAIVAIVLGLTVAEAAEDICDAYMLDVRILYVKSAFVYWFYPLIAMLELYLVVPLKHKLLWSIPYFVNALLVFIDIFDTRMIYWFRPDHGFQGGPLRMLPIAVLSFYIILLGINSVLILKSGYRSKGVIAIFMTVTSVVTAIGESKAFAVGHTETVTAIELIVYYFFLAAINYSEAHEAAYKSRIELEQERNKLLVAQIQPHFIFNSLVTVQSLCYTDSDAAAEYIDVFGDYLRANIDSLSSDEPISFESELDHINHYVTLEKAGTDVDFTMVYELHIRDFKIPPLTVQPIVENAIKHGALTRRDGSGVVKIKTEEIDGNIVITVTDNGTGTNVALTSKQKEHRSVGIENARKRLELQCGGTLEVNITGSGASAVITIPEAFRYGGQ